MSVEFEKKVALVTGGARGIGLSIAEALVREGASVFICGRNPATLKLALGQLHAFRGESAAAGTVADVRRYEECRSVVQQAATRFGRLDILVNNADVGTFKPVDQLSAENGMRPFRQTFPASSIVAAKPFRSCGRTGEVTSLPSQACWPSMVLPEAPPTVLLNSV